MSTSTRVDDVSTLLRVSHFASLAHQHQRRKSPSSPAYIQHPLDVARRIANPPSSLASREGGAPIQVLLLECSDDKTLGKMERKQAQIDHAKDKSDFAKHVKLADKLSNLNDLISLEGRPAGWSVERIQEYFVWSKKVTDQCVSVNPGLGQELDKLYREATFEVKGKQYKCHPTYQG
ncbi:hypothetical protein JCM5350_008253 [Sporobolomyces pararoseus]